MDVTSLSSVSCVEDQTAASSITRSAMGDSLQEYETQYFGFTPKSFIDGVYNALADYLYDSVDASDKYIAAQAQQKKNPVSAEAVRESSDRLLAYLQFAFDKAFDRLETYLMKNIFHIPSHVILPEDKIHVELAVTESDEMRLDAELEELRQQIHNARYVNGRLEQWSKDVQHVQSLLDSFLQQLEDQQRVCKQANVSDMKESVVFLGTRAHKLLDLSKTLQAQSRQQASRKRPADASEEEVPKRLTSAHDAEST